ncbi:MAG: hypothetical protein JXA21_21995 [Anaerolineae bacterium]|nr:hypothetical protein [Anaerolineae bacterium]
MKDSQKTLQTLVSIAAIVGTCITAIALIPAFGEWLFPRAPVSTPDIASLATQPSPTTEVVTPIPPSTLSSCFVQAETALETFKKMLHIEAQALIEGDVESFMRLHSTNVEVIDFDSGEKYDIHKWLKVNLISHQWLSLEHYDIRIAKIAGNKAWVINSAKGTFIDANNGQTVILDMKDADHRIFTKDENGCWMVTYLEVNAATRSFP